jgi:hypothetical protein
LPFDFTASLSEAKFKALQGFVCQFCHDALSKGWFGSPDVLNSPASTLKSLRYDLFVTKGVQSTPWERTLILLQEEGVKELIEFVGLVLGALAFYWLGLQRK